MTEYLVASGWSRECIAAVGFRDRFGSSIEHAAELAVAVDSLVSRCGPPIHIVAHSMGGLATRWFLHEYASAASVERVVFIATPHRGTWSAWMAWGEGGREMRPGSAFLRTLEQRPLPDHVRAYTLRTPIDTHVVPGHHAMLPDVSDRLVLLPTHRGLIRDRRVFREIRRALLDGLEEPSSGSGPAAPG